jgi:GNAT superfamily N-acetyltransferase
MPAFLQHPSESALTEAIETNLFEFVLAWERWPRIAVHDDPDLLWSLSDIAFPMFNLAVRANFAEADADQAIATAVARCKSRHVPMLWWIGPRTRPPDLGVKLLAHGFEYADEMPGMAADLTAWNDSGDTPPGLVIKPVLDSETAHVWGHTLVLGSELPASFEEAILESFTVFGLEAHSPLRHYLALLDDEPVAASTLWLGAGVAGIYNVATVPTARGRGVGTAITSAALRSARAEGCQVAILHSSAVGFNIYRRLGFKEYCKIHHYAWSP